MAARYSRLAHTQKKKNIRSAYFFVFLSIFAGIIFLYFGIPALANLSTFLSNLKGSDKAVQIDDSTPPAPPRFDSLPEATNKKTLKLKGKSESGAEVTIFFNNKEEVVIADADGEFTSTLSLSGGENEIYAKAKDQSGNESHESQKIVVVFDQTPPKLSISSPSDGAEFYGSGQRQVVIEGETDEDTDLTINDRVVTVDSDGTFTFATTLSEGENTFNLKAIDLAENESETSITVKFTP